MIAPLNPAVNAPPPKARPVFAGVLAAMIAPALVIAAVAALEAEVQSSRAAAAATAPAKIGYGPATYAAALRGADHAVALGRERVAYAPDEWLRRESLALGLLRRAQLTGSFDDYAAALAETRQAMARAPQGSGPMLTLASTAMSTHVLDDAENALMQLGKVAVAPLPPEASEIAALRGDVAFYRGDMAVAEAAYTEADAILRSPGTAIRLARLAKARGQMGAARTWFDTALRSENAATPQLAAQIALQIGGLELAQGAYGAARTHFAEADRLFAGHWLYQAHLAQARALDGDITGAIADLEALAGRSAQPDVMDALALMLRAEGRTTESRKWAARAGAIWAERMRILPEAALGHALEHELAFGTPARAVALARRNLAARPFGEARLLLAQALMQEGQFAAALGEVQRAKSAGWSSASLYALESNLMTVLGRAREAEAPRAKALALNPQIFDAETALIWFSHG